MKDYKEILKGVIDIINTTEKSDVDFTNICRYIGENCPELIENEDERTKEDLISFLDDLSILGKDNNFDKWTKNDCTKWIDWVNKQGKQDKEYLYNVIVALWDLLDKIDTVSELYITDTDPDNPFRKIMHITQERHKFVKSDGYNLFINDVKITNRKSLEKQSEQKTSDEVGPKFKVGDWIILYNNHRSIYQIDKIENYQYFLKHILGGSMHLSFALENNIKLWTIVDAKAGDILVSSNKPFIYNGKFNNIGVGAYCGLNVINNFIVAQHEAQWASNDDIKPATKEQRNSLIKAMTEAGYVFDFDKRELKKVNFDVQSTKIELTATPIITGELLIKNGFKHRSGKFSDCYDIKFNDEAYIDLIQDIKSNTEWVLEILKHNDDDQSTCANRLVATISTIKELQDCLNKMNINLKIKY